MASPQTSAPAADPDDLKPRSFANSAGICLNRYFQFEGRAPRAEYWYFALFTFLVVDVAGYAVDFVLHSRFPSIIAGLALFIPGLAVGVRRLHDIDRSGWWLLLGLVPIVGWIVLLVWACTCGTTGPNRYGLDPYAAVAV